MNSDAVVPHDTDEQASGVGFRMPEGHQYHDTPELEEALDVMDTAREALLSCVEDLLNTLDDDSPEFNNLIEAWDAYAEAEAGAQIEQAVAELRGELNEDEGHDGLPRR